MPLAKFAAELDEISEPNKSSELEHQKFRYFCSVGRSIAPCERMRAGSSVASSFITSSVRFTTRLKPVSPTNMWCASSVSMKRQVRDSGSNALSAKLLSWYLPSRSVKYVKQNSDSQSEIGSLKVVRMRGLSVSPEWRASSSLASLAPFRPE